LTPTGGLGVLRLEKEGIRFLDTALKSKRGGYWPFFAMSMKAQENDYLLRIGNNAERCIVIVALYIINAAIIHEVGLTPHNERGGRIRQESHSITHRPADAHIPLRPSHDHTTFRAFGGGATTRPFCKSALTFATADLDASLPTKCLRILRKVGKNHDSHHEKHRDAEKTFS
jgi:hypothetical protein